MSDANQKSVQFTQNDINNVLPELALLLVSICFLVISHQLSLPINIITVVILIGMFAVSIVIFFHRALGLSDDEQNYYVSYGIIVLLSVVMGLFQLCSLILLGLGMLLAIQIIHSKSEERVGKIVTVIAATFGAYFIGISFFEHDKYCQQNSFELSILVGAIAIACWKFWRQHEVFHKLSVSHAQADTRLQTLVDVVNKLTRFVPTQVWRSIISTNSPVVIDNKRQMLTVMFSDIAGFTELSESLSAEDLADILNTYMERMTLIAHRHGAVLDKFIGDGMVCFFGAPVSLGVKEDAINCVSMAIDMRREMRTLRHQWRLRGFTGLDIRIGISTGYCHVGNFGSSSRMSYTLIGKVANLASRLESAAKPGSIFLCENTLKYVQNDYTCSPKGEMKLKGFSQSIAVYEVMDPDKDNQLKPTWIDHNLSGFNLHLNFKDIKNFDYRQIKQYLEQALDQLNRQSNNENK